MPKRDNRINGKLVSQQGRMENRDYNQFIFDNMCYIQHIIKGLRGELDEVSHRKLIRQLEERNRDLLNQTKTEASPYWLQPDYRFSIEGEQTDKPEQ